MAPVAAVITTTLLAWGLGLGERGVALVGEVPGGLPALALPSLEPSLWSTLLQGVESGILASVALSIGFTCIAPAVRTAPR